MTPLGDVREALGTAVERDGFTVFRYSANVNPPAIVIGFPRGGIVSMDGAAEFEWPIIVVAGTSSEFNQAILDEQCFGPGSILETLSGVQLMDGRLSIGGGDFDQHGLVELPENRGNFYGATLMFPMTLAPG